MQWCYQAAAKYNFRALLHRHRLQCVADIFEQPEDSQGREERRAALGLALRKASTSDSRESWEILADAADSEGLFVSPKYPSAQAAPAVVAHLMEHALRPHHRSLFWGDRLCSLDKAMPLLHEPRFAALFAELNGRHQYDQYNGPHGIAWGFAVLTWAAKKALRVPGDFVECGVFEGDMSFFLVSLLDFEKTQRQFYLYDSFSGFDFSQTSPDDYPMNAGFLDFAHKVYQERSVYERVVERFAPWNAVQVIKGFLPQALDIRSPEKIAFLHIDLNAPKPELGVLERLFPRMSPGGVIVFDDYGWLEFVRQREGEDDFMKKHGYEILELPTGQGLVIV